VVERPGHEAQAGVGLDALAEQVQAGLVATDQADGRKMPLEAVFEVALGPGEQPPFQIVADHLALEFKGRLGQLGVFGEQVEEILLALGQKGQLGQVQRHHADRAGQIAGAKQPAHLVAQLAQIHLQPAAHGAHVFGRQVGIDEILEIRRPVLGREFEQQGADLGIPGEIGRDVVGGDGKGKNAALVIAFAHDLQEGLVDHLHFRAELAVRRVEELAAVDHGLAGQMLGRGQVEGQVGERTLAAPARGRVQVEHELLHGLQDLAVGEVVVAHERGRDRCRRC